MCTANEMTIEERILTVDTDLEVEIPTSTALEWQCKCGMSGAILFDANMIPKSPFTGDAHHFALLIQAAPKKYTLPLRCVQRSALV